MISCNPRSKSESSSPRFEALGDLRFFLDDAEVDNEDAAAFALRRPGVVCEGPASADFDGGSNVTVLGLAPFVLERRLGLEVAMESRAGAV